jgi:hypothetical protein
LDVLVDEGLARCIDEADVHRSGVQIDAAIEWMLLCIESHHGPPWLGEAVEPASWLPGDTPRLKIPRWAEGNTSSSQTLRPAALPNQGGHEEYPVVEPDRRNF